MTCPNIFDAVPDDLREELFTTLEQSPGVRIERIVSQGQASPEGFWYDQDKHEWILLLKGAAAVQFEDDPAAVQLRPGDYLNIAAHRRHRVVWTDPVESTVWLAVHYRAE
jgi:cupin 2 domain-containing protein